MSGSSKRILRMPRSFHSASTLSTETDFFSAITLASTPGSVVPSAYIETDLGSHGHRRFGSRLRHHGQHAAFATVAAQQCRRQHSRRLKMAAIPSERWVRVVHHHQLTPGATDQHLELDEMPYVPIRRGVLHRAALQLRE